LRILLLKVCSITGIIRAPRPENYQGFSVPDVLLSGDHENIRKWRQRESLKITLERRPDLIESLELVPELEEVLSELQNEQVDDTENELS